MKILVVDDEEIKRVSLVDTLSDGGYHTTAASDGAEALGLLKNERLSSLCNNNIAFRNNK